MKTNLYALLAFLLFSLSIHAQHSAIMNQARVDMLKKSGQLPGNFQIKNPLAAPVIYPRIQPGTNHTQSASVCDCLIPIDSTFQVVPFDFSGTSGGPGVPPDYRNDDWSSAPIALPFQFCYFGQSINAIIINNNGNVSIGNSYSTFTANSFPDTSFIMIAPFWGDVDTRGALSGLVYYQVTPTHIIVRWDHVGYFTMHDNLLNTFQLIITDGNDSLVPGGNTAFCYGDMQWTTGDASAGLNGFGGIPATVGANLGNGIDYIQFGLFDQPGYAYDGPYALNDGVDWLDSSNFIFNLCPSNVPPIPYDCIFDTIYLRVADTTDIDIGFLSPEINETTTITYNAGSLTNFTVLSNVAGNLARLRAQIIGDPANIGDNQIEITATDNGTPAQSRVVSRIVHVDTQTGIAHPADSNYSLAPNPMTDETVLYFPGYSSHDVTLVIHDILGREVYRQKITGATTVISGHSLGTGLFLYQLSDPKGWQETGKLVVH